MGDRANVYVVDEKPEHGIYFYTHWSGEDWPERLRSALASARNRWDDPQYATRILASVMFADIHGEETGGGISTFLGDNSYPILVVDFTDGTVHLAKAGSERDKSKWEQVATFDEYVSISKAEWRDLDA